MANTSNIDEVIAYLNDFVDGFDFTRVGADQSLGRDVKNRVVERIAARCALSVGPDGVAWQQNSTKSSPWLPGGYKQWKEEEYGWPDNPNYRTGQTLSATSLGAASVIRPKEIEVRYGTGRAPTRSYSPNSHIEEADKKVTDLQKAEWAHDGGASGIKRPFFGLGEGDDVAIVELCQENLNQYIRESPYGVG